MVLETHVKISVTELDFLEKSVLPNNLGKWTKMEKKGYLNLLTDLDINFYWICSIIKTYVICCIPSQTPYLGKFLFQRYGPKCYQPIRLQDFLINLSPEQMNKIAWLFACWYKFTWIKQWSKMFLGDMVINGCGQSGHRLWNWLYLKNE